MNICIVTHYPIQVSRAYGNWIPDFALELQGRGHQVSIFAPKFWSIKGGILSKGNGRIETNYFGWLGKGKLLGDLKLQNPKDTLFLLSLFVNGYRELKKFVRKKEIGVCLAIWAIPSGYFCHIVKKKLKTPYAVWVLGSDVNVYGKKLFLRSMLGKVLKDADYLFANSRGLIRSVEAISGKNCSFMATNRKLPKPKKVDLKKDVTNFLYVGRLEKVKGIDILIEAMKDLLGEGIKANLHILGDGSMREELEGRVISYKIEKNVIFHGMVNAETVSSYLANCDYLVIPSRSEGMPVVFHEAMQLKVPVIVTNGGDMGRLTRKYNVGEAVEPESIIQLKEAMKGMTSGNKGNYRQKMNEMASEFDLGKSAETFLMSIKS